jgi:hypothetical protein
MPVINPYPTKRTRDRADQVAAEMTAQDTQDWSYRAAHPHDGRDGDSQVLVFDDNEELVAIL